MTHQATRLPPRAASDKGRLPYLPGLDGLRALAVGAVLLYHADLPWLPGGFLGVEAFFVISGYLITALLLAEWRHAGCLDLRTFWLRRARRLLPALFLVLAVTLTAFVLFLPAEVAKVRGDALAALGYVTNWYFILRQQSYFEAVGRPSPLLHLWSLAIEEQFYLVWPPLLLLLLRRWGARRARWIALAGAVASAGLMAALYGPGADPSRVYYGTDTRATGILLGAALALAWTPWHDAGRPARERWLFVDMVGLGALALLVGLFLSLDEFQPALYQGGFALVALATAAAIAVAVSPRARLVPALLEWAPLRWVGIRSYGIYLWHWPIFVITRPQLDLPLDGPPLLALRLAATVVLAGLSYRYVEAPIRGGAFARAWRAAWAAPAGRDRAPVYVGSAFAGAGTALLAVLVMAVVSLHPPAPPAELAAGTVELTVGAALAAGAPPTRAPEPAAAAARPGEGAAPTATSVLASPAGSTPLAISASPAIPVPPATPTPAASPTPFATPTPTCSPIILKGITAIGDSVLVGASEQLAERLGEGLYINAALNRLPEQIPAILRERRQAGQLGDIVVIHTGNNGYVIEEELDLIMAELTGVPAVFFVNVRVPRAWERPSNRVLAANVGRYQNALLIDWYGKSAGHPEYFSGDGVHLTPTGRSVFAAMIADEVEAAKASWAQKTRCSPGRDMSPTGPRGGGARTGRIDAMLRSPE